MRGVIVLFVFGLWSRSCQARPAEQAESVVSVYTTPATTAGTAPAPAPALDVYHQIANNIAERITSPIYRFLGINTTKTETTTKRPWNHIELLDDQDPSSMDVKPINNHLAPPRDVEELSSDAARKTDRKPEKITLYSSYLPTNSKIELNDTNGIEDDDSFTLDDVDDVDDVDSGKEAREGPLIYLLELFGSVLQLLWGGFLALFRPSSSSDSS